MDLSYDCILYQESKGDLGLEGVSCNYHYVQRIARIAVTGINGQF